MALYETHIQRIIRGLKKIPRDPFIPVVSAELMDDYYHLFTDLFHLKDWLINDPKFPANKKKVAQFINNDNYLKRLQSLANGIKHLKIKKDYNKYPKAQPIFATWKGPDGKGETVAVVFNIDNQGKASKDTMLGSAFVVACLNSWNEFLLEYIKKEPFKVDQMK